MDWDAVSDVLSCEIGFSFGFNTKVSGLNSVTHLKWTPIILWFVVRCGSKNGHQKRGCNTIEAEEEIKLIIILVGIAL